VRARRAPSPKLKARAERGRSAHARGLAAEALAAWWLTAKLYRVIGRRVKTPLGEIDLVARRGGTLVFIEVKASAEATRVADALQPPQMARLTRAASLYVAARPELQALDLRFDLVLVTGRFRLRHLKDAWRP
jgi:putative endonuclease